jgi:hypothetical protein
MMVYGLGQQFAGIGLQVEPREQRHLGPVADAWAPLREARA